MDYKKYYYLEEYLFNEVKSAFYERGFLTAKEFFCIIIWKANRAKSKIAKRMKERSPDLDLQTIVKNLTKNLYKKKTSKERFVYLFDDWGFRLPMVSAILTVLFPNDFTVYDVRVCNGNIEMQEDLPLPAISGYLTMSWRRSLRVLFCKS